METLKILVADDQPLMRQAMAAFVNAEADMTVVGQAANGAEALDLAVDLKPDVVLMDLQMPLMNGINSAAEIVRVLPQTRVLAVTTFYSEDFVIPALKAGASGYIVKDAEPEDIVSAIRSVHEGNSVLSPSVAKLLLDNLSDESRTLQTADWEDWKQLTEREHDVVRCLCEGLSNKEIAAQLFLSEPTVKTHIAHIAAKVNARDRLQIVVKAYRSNVISAWNK